MKTICAILILFLLGCTHKGNKSNFISFKDSTHKFNVYFSKKDSITYLIDSISINNIKGNKQSINLTSQKIEVSKSDLNDIISIDKDFNFDGYKDIEVYRNDLSGYNYWSNHFLYNREKKKFIANKSLDSIDNIELIPEKKEICSKEREGMMGNSLVKYKWKNDSS